MSRFHGGRPIIFGRPAALGHRLISIEIRAPSRESALQRRTGEMFGSPTNCSRPMHNPPSTGPKTNGLNLSEWALKHQQMVVFLLALLSIAGVLAYTQLGQKEDPEFTVKAMLVQAHWPGSSAQQMAEQVTDKLEKKLCRKWPRSTTRRATPSPA
jgi:AcrB/AcrD/AcrF family